MNRREALVMGAASLLPMGSPAEAAAIATSLEGIRLKESVTVNGRPLILNGAGVRRRGYYKANVIGLYLPERLTTAEAIYRPQSLRRIQIHVLRDFSSSAISRSFISDFKLHATDAEFRQLIDVVAEIGALYSSLHGVSQGDEFAVDWVPNTGLVIRRNERVLGDGPINSPLAYEIYLRSFIGSQVPESLRSALLGLAPPEASRVL